MAPRWTADQVIGLAPDASSAAAGRKLASPGIWSGSGCTPTAVWGLAQGSGKKPYQAAVDLSGPAYKCSCPSRKIPCKHVLGLLLLWADGAVEAAPPAAFVEEWLASRSERAEAAEERSQRKAAVAADPDARAKRLAKRGANVTAGLAGLERLLTDLIGQGLAAARERPATAWEEQARRLVDAQAPALADRVRDLGMTLHSGRPGWPASALEQAAALHLMARAWQRGEALAPDLRDDLRARLGWPRTAEEIRASTPPEPGPWAVIGIRTIADDRFRIRRTWLQRLSDGRPALLLDFAAAGGGFDADLVLGSIVEGGLHPYPGRSGLRMTPAAELRWAGTWVGPEGTFAEALARWAAGLTADPFLERTVVTLSGITPAQIQHRWWLVDSDGQALAMGADHPWAVMALSGGHPIAITGEWDGARLHVLAAHTDGVLWPVQRPEALLVAAA